MLIYVLLFSYSYFSVYILLLEFIVEEMCRILQKLKCNSLRTERLLAAYIFLYLKEGQHPSFWMQNISAANTFMETRAIARVCVHTRAKSQR